MHKAKFWRVVGVSIKDWILDLMETSGVGSGGVYGVFVSVSLMDFEYNLQIQERNVIYIYYIQI